MEPLRILLIGDVIGKPGRDAVREILPKIKDELKPSLVIANGENSAGGLGATPETIAELQQSGVDVVTMGNHVWKYAELVNELDRLANVVRPANYPPTSPGQGAILVETDIGYQVGVINLQGRVYMEPIDSPFAAADRLVTEISEKTRIIIVDFHAEATSEKVAMGWFLDGRVTAVLGTHTHIATADERLLHSGTAYITDVGMTGPHDSVIGVKKELALHKFVTEMPIRFQVAKDEVMLEAVLVECDPETGSATGITRIQRRMS